MGRAQKPKDFKALVEKHTLHYSLDAGTLPYLEPATVIELLNAHALVQPLGASSIARMAGNIASGLVAPLTIKQVKKQTEAIAEICVDLAYAIAAEIAGREK